MAAEFSGVVSTLMAAPLMKSDPANRKFPRGYVHFRSALAPEALARRFCEVVLPVPSWLSKSKAKWQLEGLLTRAHLGGIWEAIRQ